MNELRVRLFDKRFLIEVLGGALLMMLGGFNIFGHVAASSPQQAKVLSVFSAYIIRLIALIFVFFVETKKLREKLFVPFSVLLLLLTVAYALRWMSIGGMPFSNALSNDTAWLYVRALFNINFIPLLIASFQVAKIVESRKEMPFYALLLTNYIAIVFYLVITGGFMTRLSNPRISDIFFYQFLFYFAVYFLFAYAPYFVSKGNFLKEFLLSVRFAFARFFATFFLSFFVVIFLYAFPFVLGGLRSVSPSWNHPVFYAFLLPIVMFYFFPAFYIITSVIAKRNGQ